jgi:hypothetical protein
MAIEKKSLASLKSVFGGDAKSDTTPQYTNNYYPFWSMAVGQRAIIRFLPDKNESNPRGFLVEKVTHNLTINGQKRKIPCLDMYQEECPICKISQAYYKAKDDVNGKKYWKNRQYIGQAIIVDDPLPRDENGESHEGKVRMIALGFQIYNIIKEAFAGDELEGIPYDYEDGYDFIIKKTEAGNYAGYAVGTKFANKQRSLTAQELETAEADMVDLSTLLPKHPGAEKVQAQLDAEMNGEVYDDGNSSYGSTSSAAAKPSYNDDDDESVPAAKKVVQVAQNDDVEAESDVDDMLAQIRARRKKSAE